MKQDGLRETVAFSDYALLGYYLSVKRQVRDNRRVGKWKSRGWGGRGEVVGVDSGCGK